MDIKAFPVLIVGVVVALVLAGATLPVFAETTSAEDTFTNDGYFRLNTTDGDFSFNWNYDAPTTYIFNGVAMTFDNTYDIDISVAMSDAFFIRSDRSGVVVYFNGDGVGNVIADSTNRGLTITRSSGVVTATNGSTTKTINDTSIIYYMSNSGDYIMKKMTGPAYLTDNSFIFCRGYSSVLGQYSSVLVYGTIEDGITARSGNESVVIDNPVINYNAVSNYKDLYTFDNITIDAMVGGDNAVITYSYLAVPYEVSAEKNVHPDGALTVMLNILPLLAIAGLVTGAVVWFITRKG